MGPGVRLNWVQIQVLVFRWTTKSQWLHLSASFFPKGKYSYSLIHLSQYGGQRNGNIKLIGTCSLCKVEVMLLTGFRE